MQENIDINNKSLEQEQFERNFEQTQKLQQDQKFINFIKWSKEQGILFRNIEFPVAFGSGITGVAASNRIEANQSIVAVPQKLIINKEMIMKTEIGEIMEKHPSLFNDEKYPSNEFNCFALFLIVEKLKGEKSFYYHYLQVIQQSNTLLSWNPQDLDFTEDRYLKEECFNCKSEIQVQLTKLHQCILRYPKLFPKDKVDLQLLYWAYQSVMTRIFGWDMPSAFMIPFADMFNHSDTKSLNHFMINKNLEKLDQDEKVEGYTQRKTKYNLGLIDKEFENLCEKKYSSKLNKYIIKYKEDYIQQNQQIDENIVKFMGQKQKKELLMEINKNRYKKNENNKRNYWDYNYFTSSGTEDNDTDEELYNQQQEALKKMKEREIKQLVQQKKAIQDKQQQNCLPDLQKQMQNKVFLEDLTGDSDYSKEEQNLRSSGSEQSVTESESDTESDWEWFDYDDPTEDTYFVYTTETPFEKGEQIFNCYGSRTNKFLLLWYGFTIPQNKYDSYQLRLNMHNRSVQLGEEFIKSIIFRQFVDRLDKIKGTVEGPDKQIVNLKEVSKDFKLKRDRYNDEFIIYLRLFLMTHYQGPDVAYIISTLPVSLVYESFVFKIGLHILLYIRQKFETTLEEDDEILKISNLSDQAKVAIIYRKNQKVIIEGQINIFQNIINVLESLKKSDSIQKVIKNFLGFNTENPTNNQFQINQLQQLYQIKAYLKTLNFSIKRGYLKSSHLLVNQKNNKAQIIINEKQKDENNISNIDNKDDISQTTNKQEKKNQ